MHIKYFSFSVIAGPSGWWWKLLRQRQRGHTGADWCQHSPQRLCVCLLLWLRAGHSPGGHEPPGRVFRRSGTHHGHFAQIPADRVPGDELAAARGQSLSSHGQGGGRVYWRVQRFGHGCSWPCRGNCCCYLWWRSLRNVGVGVRESVAPSAS